MRPFGFENADDTIDIVLQRDLQPLVPLPEPRQCIRRSIPLSFIPSVEYCLLRAFNGPSQRQPNGAITSGGRSTSSRLPCELFPSPQKWDDAGAAGRYTPPQMATLIADTRLPQQRLADVSRY